MKNFTEYMNERRIRDLFKSTKGVSRADYLIAGGSGIPPLKIRGIRADVAAKDDTFLDKWSTQTKNPKPKNLPFDKMTSFYDWFRYKDGTNWV